jgi:hypothetical protein
MAVVMTQTLPPMIDRKLVEELSASMDVHRNPPDGLIVHTSIETGSGIDIIDVWESAEAFHRFEQDRLGPAIGRLMQEKGLPTLPGAESVTREAFEVVRGKQY